MGVGRAESQRKHELGGSWRPAHMQKDILQGQRPRDGERHPPPEEAGFGHTDHAPTAAAAPTPCARVGTVAERIKAQDATNAVSNQHHLGERVGTIERFCHSTDLAANRAAVEGSRWLASWPKP